MPKMQSILGTTVTLLTKDEVLELIARTCAEKNKKSPLFLVTAYSETFLQAQTNKDFRDALEKATYILPDGVSVLQATDFLEHASKNIIANILLGISIGIKTLQGKYANRVTGVELVRTILENNLSSRPIPLGGRVERSFQQRLGERDSPQGHLLHGSGASASLGMTGLKILLLGGWNGVSERLARKYDVLSIDAPEKVGINDEDVILRINNIHCDILLISFGRFKQEIWIAKYIGRLNCKVVIGVGSSFDEIAGEGIWAKKVPGWVERVGLKWLWRAFYDKSHIKRAWNAFPVFPWKVFMSSIKA